MQPTANAYHPVESLHKAKRWTEMARELGVAQRTEMRNHQWAAQRHRESALFTPFNARALMGLPMLQEGRDEDL